jgi:hypothetical protein
MELQRALSQISEIHAQVLRTEVFRGYRSLPMVVTGTIAMCAAAAQPSLAPPVAVADYVSYWVLVSGICLSVCIVDLVRGARVADRREFRRRSLPVVLQFVPAIAVGAALYLGLVGGEAARLLPGLWALVYCLGVFASRPYLPRAVGWVAAFYFGAGLWLLWSADAHAIPSPWAMGLTFGMGQLLLAVVLHVNLERHRDGA